VQQEQEVLHRQMPKWVLYLRQEGHTVHQPRWCQLLLWDMP
jgi:hypothetical protein